MIKIQVKKQMHSPHGPLWLEVDLSIGQGEFVGLFGESGAGKTTLLRILAGLTQPQEGYIEVDGQVWFDSRRKINIPPQKRKTGFVFQETNLFPHMTLRQNLEFARPGKAPDDLGPWVSAMGLKGLEDQRPDKLSGGQKQKVALVRALANQPRILLLDEPLSNLDMHARWKLQEEIIKMYQKARITTILVSHDWGEIFKLSNKVFVMERGRVTHSGSPGEIAQKVLGPLLLSLKK